MLQRGFVRNVALLASGTAIGQGLGIAAAPLLSRLYDPSAFGVFGVYVAFVGILATLSSWRYENAIVLPEKDDDAVNLMGVALILVLVMSGVTAVGVATGGTYLSNILRVPELTAWLWFAPLSVLLIGVYQVFNYWSTRRKEFGRITASRVAQSGGTVITQSLASTFYLGAGGLIGGSIAGQAIGGALLLLRDGQVESRRLLGYVRFQQLIRNMRAYSDFPKFSSPNVLVYELGGYAPIFMLAYFFQPTVVGAFVMAERIVRLPAWLISRSVQQVFLQQANEMHKAGERMHPFYAKVTIGLLALGILPCGVVIASGPALFSWFLGPDWEAAGDYARWLALLVLGGFMMPTADSAGVILRAQRFLFGWNTVSVATRVAALGVGGYLRDPMVAVAGYCIFGFFFRVMIAIILGVRLMRDYSTRSGEPPRSFEELGRSMTVDEEIHKIP